jgi:hypothetical protein
MNDISESELNEETLAYIRWQEENPNVWGEQDDNGVDLARLRENLKLTPANRLRENGRALLQVRQVDKAGERYRATLKVCTNVAECRD